MSLKMAILMAAMIGLGLIAGFCLGVVLERTRRKDRPSPDSTGQGDGTAWKIIEAAETPCGTGPGDLALTIEWPDGTETLEHVSDNAARVLGYAYPDEADLLPPVPTDAQQGDGTSQEGGR